MSLYPNWLVIEGRRYLPEQPQPPRFRICWDDENIDWNYRCRTLDPGFIGPDNPPAVNRFYREPIEKQGDFRVDLASPYDWKGAIIAMNGGDYRDWEYMVDPRRAQFNTTGWPKMAYVAMSGNRVKVLRRFGDWVQFETLKQADVSRVAGWTIDTHPEFIHRFTCVTWDSLNKVTKHIEGTGTNRGQVYFPLITVEGYGWIPARHVVQLSPGGPL